MKEIVSESQSLDNSKEVSQFLEEKKDIFDPLRQDNRQEASKNYQLSVKKLLLAM